MINISMIHAAILTLQSQDPRQLQCQTSIYTAGTSYQNFLPVELESILPRALYRDLFNLLWTPYQVGGKIALYFKARGIHLTHMQYSYSCGCGYSCGWSLRAIGPAYKLLTDLKTSTINVPSRENIYDRRCSKSSKYYVSPKRVDQDFPDRSNSTGEINGGSFLKLVARISYLPNDNQNTSVRCDIITGFLSTDSGPLRKR
ncbi:hypothetical protein B0H13DRAFT_1903749 [Mycena leptocephala]|nr:hypothetical protein B0H13DRAFT_1903749 [Mycena leptocephala]